MQPLYSHRFERERQTEGRRERETGVPNRERERNIGGRSKKRERERKSDTRSSRGMVLLCWLCIDCCATPPPPPSLATISLSLSFPFLFSLLFRDPCRPHTNVAARNVGSLSAKPSRSEVLVAPRISSLETPRREKSPPVIDADRSAICYGTDGRTGEKTGNARNVRRPRRRVPCKDSLNGKLSLAASERATLRRG